MAVSGVKRNFSYLFGILTVVVYLIGLLLLINRELGIRNVLIIISALIAYYIANVYNIVANRYRLRDMATVIVINTIFMSLTVFLGFFSLYEGIILFGTVSLFQIVFRYIVNMSMIERQKILFVGQNDYTSDLLESIKKDDQYKLIGFLKDEKKEVLKNAILKICEVKKIDIIVNFRDDLLLDTKLVDMLLKYKLNGLQYYNYLEFYEKYENKLPISHLSPKWFLEDSGFEIYYNNFNLKAKRLLDLIFGMIIGICVFPIMILSAIIVKLESKGPVFFIQERIGEGNKKFNIVKFRSMTTDAEKDGPQWASKNDNRVTKWGKIMRATRIDELPQLWNVLRGEMSFVGPRPEREFFIQQLEKEIPYYNLRHTVKPGLTGWAQVKYPYGASIEDSYRKLQYDLYYIKHHDIIFDIKVLLKTITIVVFGKGR
ncbi:MAG: exopolysaccharide biosynthesis polyprenyl glycosylphosphotransferase [Leptotrichiaceae bacterium]|nr:exopolysaccharide biosynthesis polyprenyl glycosylphosphotransferase [Leptotrichiaceae bacterium]MBP6281107.1 exopolysaccharide biosynthesis polyprenyl glycosylphosphotransferase [Leptotrichiaceae bacterium]MBP7101237.1 exopolysaccharide biosynthesis polyprenyl glycosylphosphotransferase [Leptotrichiaceae bacterium]MBP7739282.1 exopolysaccharide biosynthesis polyprenyl glycosylphosphotransferase [Leptotrichiaceae bacterium]MBP9628990.1 exopolysaccharide biosynthesis polyprenyl glycosylphosph